MTRAGMILAAIFLAAPAGAQEDGPLLDRATQQLEATLKVNPADFKARTLLGRAQAQLGNVDLALEQYRSAATLGDPVAQLLAAEVLGDRGDHQAALDGFESARLAARRAGDPVRAAQAELGMAQIEWQRGNHRKALDATDRLLAGDKAVANRFRARLLSLQSAARVTLVLSEGPVAIWTDGARARAGLERALTYDDTDARALHALGRFYLGAPPGFGDADRAELLLGRAAKVRRGNATYRAWHVHVLRIRGKDDRAESELEAFEKAFATAAGRALGERLRKGEPPQ